MVFIMVFIIFMFSHPGVIKIRIRRISFSKAKQEWTSNQKHNHYSLSHSKNHAKPDQLQSKRKTSFWNHPEVVLESTRKSNLPQLRCLHHAVVITLPSLLVVFSTRTSWSALRFSVPQKLTNGSVPARGLWEAVTPPRPLRGCQKGKTENINNVLT